MITPNMQTVLQSLRPHSPQGYASFPRGWVASEARHGKRGQSIYGWFKECVDRYCKGEPQRCAVEPHIALLAEVRWRNRTELQYANLQALVVLQRNLDLDDLYLAQDAREQDIPVQYLRMDFDPTTLGLLFKEHQPHIHVHPHGEPRLAMHGSGNVVVAFLEFLYRNYCYDIWMHWVSKIWNRNAPEADTDRYPLRHIIHAFETGNAGVLLENHRDQVERLKRYLQQEADAAYEGRVPEHWLELLGFAM